MIETNVIEQLRSIGSGMKEGGTFELPLNLPLNRSRESEQHRREFLRSSAHRLRGLDTDDGSGVIGDTVAPTWQEELRNRLLLQRLGATVTLGQPTGSYRVPRIEGMKAEWLEEFEKANEPDESLGSVTARPKRVLAFVDCTRQLLRQSEGQEQVLGELAASIAAAIDRAGLAGPVIEAPGVQKNPIGLLFSDEVETVAIGEDGGAITRALLAETVREVQESNGTNLTWVGSPAAQEALSLAENETGSGRYLLDDNGRVLGLPFEVSSGIPSDLEKSEGSELTALILGDFSGVEIVGWGRPYVHANPYTKDMSGYVRLLIEMSVDVICRRPTAFRKIVDIKQAS